MSQLLIGKYLKELAKLRLVAGTNRETVVREAFKDLLKDWGRSLDLTFIPEYEFETTAKERRYVDGALLHTLRVPFGYWEAKDEKDDIDAEIATKFRRGYPKTNILFEDSKTAVLLQNGAEVMRCPVEDVKRLGQLLKLFFAYERPEIEAFRKAVEQFKSDLPDVLKALRLMIDRSYAELPVFRKAAHNFLDHAHDAINPNLEDADVREMLIQHILTGEVFAAVFPDTNYHEDNSVARELHRLEATFFTGNTKHQTLKGLAPYYSAIRKAAAEISTHHEKQTFLKAIYENFYRVYNPKAADRLGVIYTPNEIVRFMIHGADWLCEKHFKRNLIDKGVDILDPATGTGTFVSELIEYFGGQLTKLNHKYRHELHANEVAILPYYVANLNIEATYAAVSGGYCEFPGLCFVDTLDNTQALRKHKGHMDDLFGAVTDDNIKRIRQQNSRRISVIIGNPPYNANQLNENENNKNRTYPEIDKRLKETYIAQSTAQKTKLYDMYARFFRWASDRLDEDGVIAFITNRGFIDRRNFDGFRRTVSTEFNDIYLIDLGGDVRDNPKLSGTTHNVFGIQTGVAISFFVRRKGAKGCRLHYARRPEFETAREKLAWLSSSSIADLSFEPITPDSRAQWIEQPDSDFESLCPVATKAAKAATRPGDAKAIFKLYSLGVSTNRDDWITAYSRKDLSRQMSYFVARYHELLKSKGPYETDIKWSRNLKRRFDAGRTEPFAAARIRQYAYRPFVQLAFYDSHLFIDERGSVDKIFPRGQGRENAAIAFIGDATKKPFSVLACNSVADLNFLSPAAAGTKLLPLHRYEGTDRVDNITDWALEKFRTKYKLGRTGTGRKITKEALFQYVYAVLHDPVYREQYALDLQREFPRIPFHPEFWEWTDCGKALLDLHLDYETAPPFDLVRTETAGRTRKKATLPATVLKADKASGRIIVDTNTVLSGIPKEAWDFRIGNRSALEWILDQYKERAPRDPTIRQRFNFYRLADHKDHVIDLLARITTVSVETIGLCETIRKLKR